MHHDEPALSLTRAWTLVRFFDSGMLQMTTCTRCRGQFVAHAHDPQHGFVCGLCAPPSRAGKTRKAADARYEEAQAALGAPLDETLEALPEAVVTAV
jgi:flagellar transcriptional activator FlhC